MTASSSNVTKRWPAASFTVAIIAGLAFVVIVAMLSLGSGGLPGTKNSPNATVNGQSTVGKAAAD